MGGEGVFGMPAAELRALEEHIQADARWVAWVAARIRLNGPTTRPAPLSGSGTVPSHPVEISMRLAGALQDLRRRRLSAEAPHGWPVLSLGQRSLLVRAEAAAFAGRIELEGDQARDLGRLLHCTADLARIEWADPAIAPFRSR